MPQPTPLEQAFADALAGAARLDKQGIRPAGAGEMRPRRTTTNVELVKKCADFYRKNRTVMDRAVDDAVRFLASPDGIAYVKALEGSFDSAEPNPLSEEIASQILTHGEFHLATAQPQGLRGFGIGVSAGASAVVGALAGADLVFDFKDRTQVHGRAWAGLSAKGGLSLSAGLELSFWIGDKPLSGAIDGFLVDLYVPNPEFKLVVFIRFMYINQRPQGATEFEFAGVSLQFPFGIGFPYRLDKGKDVVLAVYAAAQKAWDRTRRATLDVVNKANGTATIAVKEVATLEATLHNTGDDIPLRSGATMTISMPRYFTNDDVAAMKIELSGWTASTVVSPLGNLNVVLTLSKDYTWDGGSDLFFPITNVASSSQPPVGQQSSQGQIGLSLSDTSLTNPIVANADFALVWASSSATVTWSTNTPGFKLLGPASGTVTAYADPGYQTMTLTTAVDPSGNTWVLGYQYNYNTADPTAVIPQIRAVWQSQDSPKTPKTYWQGDAVTPQSPPGTSSKAYYTGLNTNPNWVSITPKFG
ncbi:hypothetical protein JK358_21185 [Nocardia sp. 2]|uniref:Uncharacterized protein n=1 Tax=Nocardia acididurans TaxID=2802282 RepID=A0ABS1MCI5_9NOCA|nr:hypothetical protein [Nocardia acididurans]MBL1076913.1 hypothetical protein [Nocardia acididurans]